VHHPANRPAAWPGALLGVVVAGPPGGAADPCPCAPRPRFPSTVTPPRSSISRPLRWRPTGGGTPMPTRRPLTIHVPGDPLPVGMARSRRTPPARGSQHPSDTSRRDQPSPPGRRGPGIVRVGPTMPYEHHHHRDRRPAADPSGQVTREVAPDGRRVRSR
jgi:hypothetical protein